MTNSYYPGANSDELPEQPLRQEKTMNTADECIAQLEARVAALESALVFERGERIALQRTLLPPLAENRESLTMLERNVELSLQHLAERITEAAASGDGDIRAVSEAVHTLVAEMMNRCLDHIGNQTLTAVRMQHEVMMDGTRVLVDRIIALERRFRLLELFLNARFIPEAA